MIESLVVWLVVVFGAFWWLLGLFMLLRGLAKRERNPEERESYGPFRK